MLISYHALGERLGFEVFSTCGVRIFFGVSPSLDGALAIYLVLQVLGALGVRLGRGS